MPENNVFHVSGADEQAFSRMLMRETQQYGVVFYDLARRITGWTAQDVLRQFATMLFVPEDRERRLDEHKRTPRQRSVSAKTNAGTCARTDRASGRAACVMHRQIDAIERLVEDLVDLTRVHAGKMSIVHEQATLQPVLAQVMDACRTQAARRGVELHLVAPSVPIAIEVDTRRCIQVLNNLINDAAKFTHRGGHVWVTATVAMTHIVLYLKDEGAGIAPDLLQKIFDVFTQAASAGSGRGAGIGIGLSVAKESWCGFRCASLRVRRRRCSAAYSFCNSLEQFQIVHAYGWV